jgi:hypothetical protein
MKRCGECPVKARGVVISASTRPIGITVPPLPARLLQSE